MRPLTINRDDDRGAVLVWVALMLTVMLGIGALVVDAGALYAERRQLQNGADAAVLAVAADCAEGACLNEMITAEEYADRNANDGAATVDEVCGSAFGLSDTDCGGTPPAVPAGATGWVQVSTSTDNPANANREEEVDFVLAPVLDAGNVGSTVRASAAAAWGPIGGAVTFPFTFSVCEFDHFGGSASGGEVPKGVKFIYSHGTPPPEPDWDCEINPNSGADYPGGFGWLDNEQCQATVGYGWVGGDTGNTLKGCDDAQLEAVQGSTLVIPLYDETSGTGSNAEYHIVGFAGFKLLGYRLVGDRTWGDDSSPPWDKQGNKYVCPSTNGDKATCLYGEFVEVTTTGSIGVGGSDYGATAISMIG